MIKIKLKLKFKNEVLRLSSLHFKTVFNNKITQPICPLSIYTTKTKNQFVNLKIEKLQ